MLHHTAQHHDTQCCECSHSGSLLLSHPLPYSQNESTCRTAMVAMMCGLTSGVWASLWSSWPLATSLILIRSLGQSLNCSLTLSNHLLHCPIKTISHHSSITSSLNGMLLLLFVVAEGWVPADHPLPHICVLLAVKY